MNRWPREPMDLDFASLDPSGPPPPTPFLPSAPPIPLSPSPFFLFCFGYPAAPLALFEVPGSRAGLVSRTGDLVQTVDGEAQRSSYRPSSVAIFEGPTLSDQLARPLPSSLSDLVVFRTCLLLGSNLSWSSAFSLGLNLLEKNKKKKKNKKSEGFSFSDLDDYNINDAKKER